MRNVVISVASVAGACIILSSGAFAQEGAHCRAEMISATGTARLSHQGGTDSAIRNWRRSVILKYGELYAEYSAAKGKADDCARTLLGLYRCEAKGQPCRSDAAGRYEIACNSADSSKCSSEVKWIQTRLVAKGYRVRIDGSEGDQTVHAIIRFKKANNLGDGSSVDERVLAALAA